MPVLITWGLISYLGDSMWCFSSILTRYFRRSTQTGKNRKKSLNFCLSKIMNIKQQICSTHHGSRLHPLRNYSTTWTIGNLFKLELNFFSTKTEPFYLCCRLSIEGPMTNDWDHLRQNSTPRFYLISPHCIVWAFLFNLNLGNICPICQEKTWLIFLSIKEM